MNSNFGNNRTALFRQTQSWSPSYPWRSWYRFGIVVLSCLDTTVSFPDSYPNPAIGFQSTGSLWPTLHRPINSEHSWPFSPVQWPVSRQAHPVSYFAVSRLTQTSPTARIVSSSCPMSWVIEYLAVRIKYGRFRQALHELCLH